MRESELEKKVVAHCRMRGLLCYKFSSPARRGVPDRLIVGRGQTMFLELKAPGKKPTALQFRELGLLRKEGMLIAWTDDLAWAKFEIDRVFGVDEESML